jgi:hypothetical protein
MRRTLPLLLTTLLATAAAAAPRLIFRDTQTHQGPAPTYAFAGRFVVVMDEGVGVRVYDAATGEAVRTIPVDGLSELADPGVMAVDGETVAVAAPGRGRVELYDVGNGAPRGAIDVPIAGDYEVALRGGKLLVGVPSFDTSANRVYLFDAGASGALPPLAIFAPPDAAYRRFGSIVRFADGRVVCIADTPAEDADALFAFQPDPPYSLLTVAQSPGLSSGMPSQFVLVGDDLVAGFGGNDLPDEGPIAPSHVEMRSLATGALRWRRHRPTDTLGTALAAVGDDTLLVSAVPEFGRTRVFQLERRTGRILRTVASGRGDDTVGVGLVADATRALVGAFTRDGFVIQLHDLSPCGATSCGDVLQANAFGRKVGVHCPPVPAGGSCSAVAFAGTEDGKTLTNRVHRAASPARGVDVDLSLNAIGRLLYAQATHLSVQVAVTIRSRDGRVAVHVVPAVLKP